MLTSASIFLSLSDPQIFIRYLTKWTLPQEGDNSPSIIMVNPSFVSWYLPRTPFKPVNCCRLSKTAEAKKRCNVFALCTTCLSSSDKPSMAQNLNDIQHFFFSNAKNLLSRAAHNRNAPRPELSGERIREVDPKGIHRWIDFQARADFSRNSCSSIQVSESRRGSWSVKFNQQEHKRPELMYWTILLWMGDSLLHGYHFSCLSWLVTYCRWSYDSRTSADTSDQPE